MNKRIQNQFLEKIDLVIVFSIGIFLARSSNQAIRGDFRGSWGYGEFWINFSGGYVRRGLSGEILLKLRDFGLDNSYLIVVMVVTVIIWLNFIMMALLIRRITPSPVVRTYIQLNATLFMFIVYNPNVYIRKDHLIIFGLLLHALIADKVNKSEMSAKKYEIFIWLLIPSLLVSGQMHETQALFIPVHMYLYLKTVSHSNIKVSERFTVATFISVMFGTLILSTMFNGSIQQAESIIASIPPGERPEIGAIQALGWTSQEAIQLSLRMFKSEATLLCFGLILIVGPILIATLTNQFNRSRIFLEKFLMVLPIMFLFILGWDWGRWLNMLSVTIICLAIYGSNNQASVLTKMHTLPIASLISVLIFSIMWRAPECCTRAPEEAFLNLLNFLHSFGLHLTPN